MATREITTHSLPAQLIPSADRSVALFFGYLRVEKNLAALTIDAYRSDLAQLSKFLARPLITAKREDIRQWLEQFQMTLNPRSVARKVATLRHFFKFLLMDRLIVANPMLRIESPKVGKRLPDWLTESEMNTILMAPRGDEKTALRDQAILELFYGAALRVSELAEARVCDLNLTEGLILVRGKGDKERIAPVGRAVEVLKLYLKNRQRHSQWLFPAAARNGKKGSHLTRQALWLIVGKSSQQIGRHIHPHMWRHSFATHMLDNGADLRTVQTILGHAEIDTTQIYAHVTLKGITKNYMDHHPRATGKHRQMPLEWEAAAKLVGYTICSQCPAQACEGKSLCPLHLKLNRERNIRSRIAHRERNNRSYRDKIDRGQCGHCAKPLAVGSKSCCAYHAELFRNKSRTYRRGAA